MGLVTMSWHIHNLTRADPTQLSSYVAFVTTMPSDPRELPFIVSEATEPDLHDPY